MAPPAALYLALLLLVASCGAEKNGGAPAGEELEWKAAGCKLEAEQQIQELKEADQQSGNSSQLLFLGDSITEVWRGTFCGVPCNPVLELHCDQFAGLMQRYFGQYNPMVQAVAGDRTAHLLWRINQGGLPTQHQPKVVVLLIGINDLANLGMNAPGNDDFSWKLFKAAPTVANRIEETVKVVQERLPSSQILLLGLLPAGIWGLPGQANYRWPSPYKRAVATVNTQLSAYAATQSRVQFLDCGMRFLNSNRTAIDAALLPDSLHPSAAGMERGIAQCIKPLVDLLMQV